MLAEGAGLDVVEMRPLRAVRHLLLLVLSSVAVVAVVAGFCAPRAHAADRTPTRVTILIADKDVYQQAAKTLEAELAKHDVACLRLQLPAGDDAEAKQVILDKLAASAPSVVAAGGVAATDAALTALPETPVVFFMVPHAKDASFLQTANPNKKRVAGVTSDVDPAAQAEWVKTVSPKCRRVAILHSDRTKKTVEALETVGRRSGVMFFPIAADRTAFPKAIESLNANECDGVLMIPDAHVYNAPTVQRLLLWGLRRQKTVVTFSPHLAKAGALASVAPDAGEVGRQAAGIVLKIAGGAAPASIGIQYPAHTKFAINERTARMIDLRIDRRRIPDAATWYGDE